MKSKVATTKCPRCGRVIELLPCPDKPGRVEGRCVCNPFGPVIETDETKPLLEEVIKHDSANH